MQHRHKHPWPRRLHRDVLSSPNDVLVQFVLQELKRWAEAGAIFSIRAANFALDELLRRQNMRALSSMEFRECVKHLGLRKTQLCSTHVQEALRQRLGREHAVLLSFIGDRHKLNDVPKMTYPAALILNADQTSLAMYPGPTRAWAMPPSGRTASQKDKLEKLVKKHLDAYRRDYLRDNVGSLSKQYNDYRKLPLILYLDCAPVHTSCMRMRMVSRKESPPFVYPMNRVLVREPPSNAQQLFRHRRVAEPGDPPGHIGQGARAVRRGGPLTWAPRRRSGVDGGAGPTRRGHPPGGVGEALRASAMASTPFRMIRRLSGALPEKPVRRRKTLHVASRPHSCSVCRGTSASTTRTSSAGQPFAEHI